MARASEQEGWQIELTPYLWAVGAEGDVTTRGEKFEFDKGFDDIQDNIDSAFMGLGVISYNRFVFYVNYDYVSLSGDTETRNGVVVPAGTRIDADLDVNIVTGGIGYRFDTFGDKSFIDVIVGMRNLTLDREFDVAGLDFSREEDVTDGVLILRPSFQISEKWRFNPTLSYGSGDSEQTYELSPQLQWDFSDYFALRFGYKTLHYEIEDGDKGTPDFRETDVDFSGPFIGLGWKYPAPAKPVAAAAPAPMPAPLPAKCPDTDGDGVCDSADQCPNTPPGKRVGAGGCDCDYTLALQFAFDSAELTEKDKAKLDELVPILNNPELGFIAGEVVGHSDSIGSEKYNLALSQRRAEAVASYLRGRGVQLGSRFSAQGMGERQPIADNHTDEGRAQNRRVVIRRTDCPAP
jgi:outer membrane protein OmpA-like peptidoglycan-associated protein